MITSEQQFEIDKYRAAYRDPRYKMGPARTKMSTAMLETIPVEDRTAYMDVGCGRGEMLDIAEAMGFDLVTGVEPSPHTALDHNVSEDVAWDINVLSKSYSVVSMFDVIEHLLFDDQIPALQELKRIASDVVLITAADFSSKHKGVELHPGRRSYDEFDTMIRGVFSQAERVNGRDFKSASMGWICRVG